MVKSVSDNSDNSLTLDNSNSYLEFIKTIFLCILYIILIPTLFGTNLLFFIWSLTKEAVCSSNNETFFDYIFKQNADISDEKKTNVQMGGSNIGNCLDKKEIKDFCKINNNIKFPKFDGILGLIFSFKDSTNYDTNKFLKMYFARLSTQGIMCRIIFLFAIPIIGCILFILLFFTPIVMVVNTYNLLDKHVDGFINNLISKCIFFATLFLWLWVPFLYGTISTIFIAFKLLLYPMFFGGKKLLLELIKQNLSGINLLIFINNLVLIIKSKNILDTGGFTALLCFYIPITIYQIYFIFKNFY